MTDSSTMHIAPLSRPEAEAPAAPRPGLSIVVPVYRGAATVGRLVAALSALSVHGGMEIVLVNDGSPDNSGEVCRDLVAASAGSPVPVTLVEHARNYGEHNAVMTGLRHARGDFIITMDDDLQNPPEEVVHLYDHTRLNNYDVVYTRYAEKKHDSWRNIGSRFANQVADWLLDKPKGLYLSSFRCMSRMVARAVIRYRGPYPYVDGLIMQVTQRIGSIEVRHEARQAGESTYTLRRLIRLWMSAWVNFSILPLRVATILGLVLAGAGVIALVFVAWLWFQDVGPNYGFGWLMAALLVFSGTQLVLLGLIGEYIGRMFLAVNQRPQSVVREVVTSTASAALSDTAATTAPSR